MAHYQATGKRDLLDKAIASAEMIHRDFLSNDPPFNGGERDSWNCAQLYRITGDPGHLEMARHYLDQYPELWNWVRLSLGRTAADSPDAWVALRDAQDIYWADDTTIDWPVT